MVSGVFCLGFFGVFLLVKKKKALTGKPEIT